jgi:hypothetical protein
MTCRLTLDWDGISLFHYRIAQLVEHLPFKMQNKQDVSGSIPDMVTLWPNWQPQITKEII